MKKGQSLCVALIVLVVAAPSFAGILVHFGEPFYTVDKGDILRIDVILDADDQLEGDQSLPNGLASMSFEMFFDDTGLSVLDVDLPSILTNDGLDGPPRVELTPPGFARVRAAVFFLSDEFYLGEESPSGENRLRLATLEIMADLVGDFDLGLKLWQPAGSADEGFVDGQQNTLDGEIQYGQATVRVVPEPTTLTFIAAGVLLGASRGRRS